MRLMLLSLALICGHCLATVDCNIDSNKKRVEVKKRAAHSTFDECKINGRPIKSGACVLYSWSVPEFHIGRYIVDATTGHAEYSADKFKTKKVKLSAKQILEFNCLSYAVWIHENKRKLNQQIADEENTGKLPTPSSSLDTDLASQVFDASEFLTLVDGNDAKIVGGFSEKLDGDAAALYQFIVSLF